MAAIHLGRSLLTGSSALPAHSTGPVSNVRCLGLLRVGFTEPLQSPGALVVSYTTVSPLPAAEAAGGLFSVALSRESPRVAVGHHPALWSPDVPRQDRSPDATAWPTHPWPSIGRMPPAQDMHTRSLSHATLPGTSARGMAAGRSATHCLEPAKADIEACPVSWRGGHEHVTWVTCGSFRQRFATASRRSWETPYATEPRPITGP